MYCALYSNKECLKFLKYVWPFQRENLLSEQQLKAFSKNKLGLITEINADKGNPVTEVLLYHPCLNKTKEKCITLKCLNKS